MVKIGDYLLIFRICQFMAAKYFWLTFDKIIEDKVLYSLRMIDNL